MDAQRIAIDAIVALTDCDREAAAAFIRKFYLAGVKDPKRLTSRACRRWRGARRSTSIIYRFMEKVSALLYRIDRRCGVRAPRWRAK